MENLPQEVIEAWNNKEDAIVLTTISKEGVANSIYVTCTGLYEGHKIVIADNYFEKTRANILDGSAGAVLFITNGGKAYQLKGALEYHKEGAVFDFMKTWNPEQHPGHAAVALIPETVYSGAEQVC